MDDTISRQDAIDVLHEYFDGMLDTDTVCPADIYGLFECIPSAQPEPHWIPWCSGKFPEESGCYIVTAYDGSGSRVTFAKYQKRLKRWELTGARAYWRVLAWMPLPEPYGEDDHETG